MGFLSFEHNVLFSFLSHSAQIFICWYIIEGWVSEGSLVRQGTLHENGESWAKKRIELLNNVSNWSYFVLKIDIKKIMFCDWFAPITLFQKCWSVLLQVKGYLVKMLIQPLGTCLELWGSLIVIGGGLYINKRQRGMNG